MMTCYKTSIKAVLAISSNRVQLHGTKSVLMGLVIIVIVLCIGSYLWTASTNTIKIALNSSQDQIRTASIKAVWNSTNGRNKTKPLHYARTLENTREGNSSVVHIATVICGNRLEEGLTMLKSAMIFSKSNIVFHIFTEKALRQSLLKKFNSWPVHKRLEVKLYDPYFPAITTCPGCETEDWSNLFAPCAAQRLYFPDILTELDSLIYVDSDSLFLSPVEDVWAHFTKFTPNQIAGIIVELSGWYEDKTFPYCTETGVNSGVMLMNLTRMRPQRWIDKLVEYYNTYKQQLRLWDQDLINIYCHFHQDQIYVLPCPWNYRGTFCPSDRPCNEAETQGAYILHGNSQVFHNAIFPAIREVYRSVKEHNLTTHTTRDLFNRMVSKMKPYQNTACGARPHIFTRNVEQYILTNEQASGR